VWVFRDIFCNGGYDMPLPKRPEFIVDLGAYTGLSVRFFAQKWPGSRIAAVEPDQANFDMMKLNLRSDCAAVVIPLHAAIWTEEGEIELADVGLGDWGKRALDKVAAPDEKKVKVRAITMEHVMAAAHMDHIDLLKCDIEGAEKALFGFNADWLMKVGAVVIETHERLVTGCDASVETAMHKYGFRERPRHGECRVFWRAE
jgi:FkbM family methyltransferase